jgi:hypothetical protein
MKLSELKRLVEGAAVSSKLEADRHKGDPNPQVKELYLIADARHHALAAVVQAMEGDAVMLKLLIR